MADFKLSVWQERTVSDLALAGADAFSRFLSSPAILQRLTEFEDMEGQRELLTSLSSWVHREIQEAVSIALKGHKVDQSPVRATPPPPPPGAVYPAQFTHASGKNWPEVACGLNYLVFRLPVDITGKTVDCPACLKNEKW